MIRVLYFVHLKNHLVLRKKPNPGRLLEMEIFYKRMAVEDPLILAEKSGIYHHQRRPLEIQCTITKPNECLPRGILEYPGESLEFRS